MSRGQGRVYLPKGKGKSQTFWLDYTVRGKRHRESAHTTHRSEALDLLRDRVGKRKAGTLTGRPDAVTVADLRVGLEAHYQREGNKSLKRAQQALEHLVEFFGSERRALDVKKADVRDYVATRTETGAALGTVRYEVAVLKTAYSVAVDDEKLAVQPPFKLPPAGSARVGFFEEGDFAALLLELPTYARPVVRFLRMTGWRKSEVLNLTWDQVDRHGQVIRIHADQTKGGDARVFPFGLAPDLAALLGEQWEARSGLFVFHRNGRRIMNLRSAWARACRRADLPGRLIHDLRRTAARDFRRQGVSEGEIMRLCGWKTRAMFDRYNIIDEADLAAAVARRFNGNGIPAAHPGTPTVTADLLSSVPATGRRSSDG